MTRRRPLADRFWAKVERTPTCWAWTAAINDRGYGQIVREDGRIAYAHRVSYEFAKGEIPPGYVIDHLCRNRRCVNPDHLEVVTPAENTRRGLEIGPGQPRQSCSRGHDWSQVPPRVVHRSDGRVSRYCRLCARASESRSQKKRWSSGLIKRSASGGVA